MIDPTSRKKQGFVSGFLKFLRRIALIPIPLDDPHPDAKMLAPTKSWNSLQRRHLWPFVASSAGPVRGSTQLLANFCWRILALEKIVSHSPRIFIFSTLMEVDNGSFAIWRLNSFSKLPIYPLLCWGEDSNLFFGGGKPLGMTKITWNDYLRSLRLRPLVRHKFTQSTTSKLWRYLPLKNHISWESKGTPAMPPSQKVRPC